MYVNEEFTDNVLKAPYFLSLEQWVLFCARTDDKERVYGRFPRFDGDSVALYLRETTKFYTTMKCCPPSSVTVNKYGVYIDRAVYDFKPLNNIGIMGLLYVMSITDTKDYYGEDVAKGKIILNGLKELDKEAAAYLLEIVDGQFLVFADGTLRLGTPSEVEKLRRKKPRTKVVPPPSPRTGVLIKVSEVQLSVLFSEELRTNDAKRLAFVKVIREKVTPKVLETHGSHDAKWKWPHVQLSLFKSSHIVSTDNKSQFAKSMTDVTGCTKLSIEQSFKRYKEKPTDVNIIKEIQTLIDTAIDKATDEKHETRLKYGSADYGDLLDSLEEISQPMAIVVYHLLSLEQYFCEGCTKELLVDCFKTFAEDYPKMLDKFDPKSMIKIMCQLVWRLWRVGFIKGDVPCQQEATALAGSFTPKLDEGKLNRYLMGVDKMDMPKGYQIFFDLLEEHIAQKTVGLTLRKDDIFNEKWQKEEKTPVRTRVTSIENFRDYSHGFFRSINPMLTEILKAILSLHEYYFGGVTEETILEHYKNFVTYIDGPANFEPRYIHKNIAHFVRRLQELNVIRSKVPTMQLARTISDSCDNINVNNLRAALIRGNSKPYLEKYAYIYEAFDRSFGDFGLSYKTFE